MASAHSLSEHCSTSTRRLVSVLIVACHTAFLTSQLSGCWQTEDTQDLNGAGIFRIVIFAEIENLQISGLASFFLPDCDDYLSPAPPPPPSPPPSPPPPHRPPLPPPPPDSEYYWYSEPRDDEVFQDSGRSRGDVRDEARRAWRRHAERERCEPDGEQPAGAVSIDLMRSVCQALSCGTYTLVQPLFQFSYIFSLYDLYKTNRTMTPDGKLHPTDIYHGPGACTLDGVCPEGSRLVWPGQLGAVLLFLASFLWPHVKLGLLHAFFYARLGGADRRNGNYWLAFFGKWSFVDVLVMISLLGVLDLKVRSMDVELDAVAFSGVSTGLSAQLRLEGQLAMYWFCVAVVLSLSIGVHIETLDDAQRERSAQRALLPQEEGEAAGGSAHGRSCVAALRARAVHCCHTAMVALTLGLVLAACRAPLLTRIVSGAVPELLRDYGQELNENYTLLELARLSSRAGGFDYLMSATFWIFVVVGPALRSLSQLVALTLPLPLRTLQQLHRMSRHVSVFYSLEVMVVAVPLLSQIISNLANGLLTESSFPPCTELVEQYGGPCLAIDVEPREGYWLMFAAVAMYLVCGFDGSLTHKYLHRQLYPEDVPPPHCCPTREAREDDAGPSKVLL